MALEFIKLVKGDSPVAQVGSYGFFKLDVESGGGGGGDFDRVFGNNTPEQIAAVSAVISANNMTSAQVAETYGWNIGDTIDIPLSTGVTMTSRIVGINHNPDLGESGISLHSTVSALSNSMGGSNGNFGSSTMLSTHLPNILSTMPDNWQNVIKPVQKQYYPINQDYATINISESKLFILSTSELKKPVNFRSTKIGTPYEYYVSNTPKSLNGWTRERVHGNVSKDYYVNLSGGYWSTAASNTWQEIRPAFCI